MSGRVVTSVVWVGLFVLASCQSERPSANACGSDACPFEIGGPDDPVIRMAMGPSFSDDVDLSISNTTGRNWTEGLVVFSALFQAGEYASQELVDYAARNGANSGDATAFAAALGLTLGVDAFVFPAISRRSTQNMIVQVPGGAEMFYIARIDRSRDDFVANDVGAPVGGTLELYPFDLDDDGGRIQRGNGTLGNGSQPVAYVDPNPTAACTGANAMGSSTLLFADDFTAGANDPAWPTTVGYGGDFNGDWYTDGVSARPWPGSPNDVINGFFRYVTICPTAGAAISIEAEVVTEYATDPATHINAVLYFFDDVDAFISHDVAFPVRSGNSTVLRLDRALVPAATRRIAFAIMSYLGPAETDTVYVESLQVDYEPPSGYTEVTLASDDFSNYSNGQFGDNQPDGWAEYGGDWAVDTRDDWVTLWNNSWDAEPVVPLPYDAGLYKTFSLSGAQANSVVSGIIFAALGFTDAESFVRMRFLFSTGEEVESARMSSGYGDLSLANVAIPTGATDVTVYIETWFGPNETSSLYADDFELRLTTPVP